MKNFVEIYDTTLRDGPQGEGVSFSVADKLRVAEKLDAFGVHYVEGGGPGSNPKDIEFFKQAAKRKWRNTQIAAFGSTRRKKIAAKDDPQVKLLIAAKKTSNFIFSILVSCFSSIFFFFKWYNAFFFVLFFKLFLADLISLVIW